MKSPYRIILLLLTASMLLNGCEKTKKDESNKDELPPETTAASSVEPSIVQESAEPDLHDDSVSIDGNFVYDDAKVFSEKEMFEINNEAAHISRTFKLNCAVVTAAQLGGKSASQYAEEYYKKLYSSSNGVMFLINNDTGEDYILRKGAPALFITNDDIEMLFTKISPLLVTEKYVEASNIVMSAFAERLPEFAVDRTNTLEKAEIEAVNDILASAKSDGNSISMILIGTFGNKTIEEYANAQYINYMSFDSGSSALITLNIQTGEYYICGGGKFPGYDTKDQEALKEAVDSCLNDSGTEKSFDLKKAAEIFVNFMTN